MRYFFILLFSIVFSGLAAQATSENVHKGLLRVKFKQDDEVQLSAKPLRASANAPLRLGIRRFDALLEKYGAVEMKRVYPDAGIYEAKHRKHGLHLWYDVVISEDIDPEKVSSAFTDAGLVQHASPVYKIVRIGGENTAMELTEQVEQLANLSALPTNDPYLPKQWSFYNNGKSIPNTVEGVDISLFDAWDETMGNSSVIVCVVDGGVDYQHTDLAANMWVNHGEIPNNGIDDDNNGFVDDVYGYDFVFNAPKSIMFDIHGTHVAGTIAAVSNNGVGVAGIAGGDGTKQGVRIMTAQIFYGNAVGNVGRAIVYGADNGAVISQNSWGYEVPDTYNQDEIDAIRYFIEEAGTDHNGNPRPGTPMVGGIVICAAGNNGVPGKTYYPGAITEAIAVAAVAADGKRANYSNCGPWVNISAPGGNGILYTSSNASNLSLSAPTNILSTAPNGSYWYYQGTSMACPHVSGVAALILSKYGSATYTPRQLRSRLLLSAKPISDPVYASMMGVGLLDASQALAMVPVEGIEVAPTTLKMFVGDRQQLSYRVTPSHATYKDVEWSSSNPKVLTVSSSGLLEAISYDANNTLTPINISATTVDGAYRADVSVIVHKDVEIPEGFSPNNDGKNDFFEMVLDDSESYSLAVFDKSGQICYESAGYGKNASWWDGVANRGKHRGSKVAIGTYYYTLQAQNSGVVKKGYVVVKY